METFDQDDQNYNTNSVKVAGIHMFCPLTSKNKRNLILFSSDENAALDLLSYIPYYFIKIHVILIFYPNYPDICNFGWS